MAGISYVFTISRVAEICHQFGGSASEISCASLLADYALYSREPVPTRSKTL
jgi:hypothetical protein